jgi:hypothetical protein
VHGTVSPNALHTSALRWLGAALAACAFVVTLSVQTVRAAGDVPVTRTATNLSAVIAESDDVAALPAAEPVSLRAVAVPALRAPVVRHKPRRHRSAPAASKLVVAVAPTPVAPAPVPTPPPAPAPVVVAPAPVVTRAPVAKPPAAPARGPAFDSAG